VIITRAEAQGSDLAELLAGRGAVPVALPLITVIDDPNGIADLAEANPLDYEWIVVTSPNGGERLTRLHPMVEARVGAVGAATALSTPRCDFVPEVQSAAGFVAEFPPGTGRVLVVQAANAAPTMVNGLTALGYEVIAITPYHTVATPPTDELRRAAAGADAVLFASGSAAEAWASVFGTQTPPVVVAIGPQTAAIAERAGVGITIIAREHSMQGLVDALVEHWSASATS